MRGSLEPVCPRSWQHLKWAEHQCPILPHRPPHDPGAMVPTLPPSQSSPCPLASGAAACLLVTSDTGYHLLYRFKTNNDQVTLVGQVFQSYVSGYYKNDILLIWKERDEDAYYPEVVNAMTLSETNMEIAE
uniref:MCM9 N-terminal domain-containing protein n=1 Tax=Equus caballus TaxID=9796 RepID=A0A9L0TL88_HORSE